MSSTEGTGSHCSSPRSSASCEKLDLNTDDFGDSWVKLARLATRQDVERDEAFSVAGELTDAVVLLTGSTGYIGSLLLELMLRVSPGVRKVYLLIRNKKGVPAGERLDSLLSGPVFRAHNPEILKPKLEVVNADMAEPQCGLSDAECDALRDVNYVIHCAASIRFDMQIQEILAQTFAPTDTLLSLAARMPGLRCFTFISTAFVNANLPGGTCVQERVYPLLNNSPADEADIARRLLQLPPERAEAEAKELMEMNGLQNTYFLAKNLTERVVAAADGKPHRVCIMRPSIVGAVARSPWPGFIGNSSGFTAAILGASAGIVSFAQHSPRSVITIVPGDMVAATTLVATTAHGRAASLQEPPPCSMVVHSCTSATNPINIQRLYLLCCMYLNEDPPLSGSMRKDYKVDWVENPVLFWLRCLMHSLTIFFTAQFLKYKGQHRLARRLSFAWEKWHELATKRFDFNLTFQTSAAQTLEKMLGPEELGPLQITWRAEAGDSWLRYLRTYVAGTKHLYRNEAPTVFDIQDYRPCPPRA